MEVKVKAIPRSKKPGIEEISKNELVVRLKSAAVDNKANEELIKVLAEHFKVAKSRISIKFGQKSRNKLVKIEDI